MLGQGNHFMGQMRFVIPQPERVVADAAEQAYLAGADGIPWECQRRSCPARCSIERDTRESGYLYFPWNVPGRGVVMLVSGSLMERPRPYNLPVELARGTLNRLRNQIERVATGGDDDSRGVRRTRCMQAAPPLRLGCHAAGPAAGRRRSTADEAIRMGLDAADLLMPRIYAASPRRFAAASKRRWERCIGCRLAAPPSGAAQANFLAAFNTVLIARRGRRSSRSSASFSGTRPIASVQWCRDQNLRLCLGPLVQFDQHSLPDWLFLDDDYEEVQLGAEVLDAVVKRYRGKVQLWHVAAGMNQDGAFEFSEEQRLRLVVEAVDRVRALDARTPMVVSFDQPWGEYIARKDQELTPLHFADTLVRGELGLAGIGLEMQLRLLGPAARCRATRWTSAGSSTAGRSSACR